MDRETEARHMSIASTHPDFDEVADSYRQMSETFDGQAKVKEMKTRYLRATSSMVIDGALKAQEPGYGAYLAYLDRAIFPEIVSQAVATMTGLLNKDLWHVELPSEMEPILTNATRQGETLHQLLRRIHVNQLLYGRIGLVIDTAPDRDLPFFVTYDARSIINWDDDRDYASGTDRLNFVVTEEIKRMSEGIGSWAWTDQEVHRAFLLEDGIYKTYTEMDQITGETVVPTYRGRSLDYIPWTFIGATDLEATPGFIPLLGTSNAALSIYGAEADFRQSLHMLGQSTLVLTGVAPGSELDDDQPMRVGAGAIIELPEGADAKFIGVGDIGLTEQRMALDELYKRALAEGARLMEQTGSQAESGTALKVRIASKSATLRTIARVSALGLETALKQMADWMGIDGSGIFVTPKVNFADGDLPGTEMLSLVQAKNLGLPISYSTMHNYLLQNDVTELTWDKELAEIAAEGEVLEALRSSSFDVAARAEQVAHEETVAEAQTPNEDEVEDVEQSVPAEEDDAEA
jgi:hypothetical protein